MLTSTRTRTVKALTLLAALGLLLSAPASFATPTNDGTFLTAATPINLPGGAFDFMGFDAAKKRVFACHPRNNDIAIVDTKTNALTVINTIVGMNGIAFDDADQRIFMAGPGQKLLVLDSTSLHQVAYVDLTGPGDSVLYDPKNGQVYVDNDDGKNVWVFDAKTAALKATIAIPEAPEVEVYNPADNKIYQNIKLSDELVVIDPTTNTVTAHWPVAPASKPHGLAIDVKSQRLFSAGANGKLAVIDIASGKTIATVDIAPRVDQIAIDEGLGRIYCASSTGVFSVVRETPDGANLVANIITSAGAKSVAVDTGTHDVWIAYADKTQCYLQKFAYSAPAK